jgi:hypothetical protein
LELTLAESYACLHLEVSSAGFERMLAQQHGEAIVADLAELTEAERLTRLVGPPIQQKPSER